jgi:hypothetical protein
MINISFNYNEDTNTIDNIVIRNYKSFPKEVEPIVEVKENKLVLSPKAISMLQSVHGDRVSINYVQDGNELTFPIIGKSSVFADQDSGNRLTKSNTVSFRGFQRDLLLKYGTIFILEEFRDNIFRLVPKVENPFDIKKVF